MSVFKSGAFLQQCFSVHPLTLNLKIVTPPDLVGVFCTNCRMKHRMIIRQVTLQEFRSQRKPTTRYDFFSIVHRRIPKMFGFHSWMWLRILWNFDAVLVDAPTFLILR